MRIASVSGALRSDTAPWVLRRKRTISRAVRGAQERLKRQKAQRWGSRFTGVSAHATFFARCSVA